MHRTLLLIAAAHESGSGTFETCRAAGTEAQVSPAQKMGADRRVLTERTHSLRRTANRRQQTANPEFEFGENRDHPA
jgi:hypothetical protein